MAGFMDMLGKRPEGESVSAYQKTVLKEIARKLSELEEQNDQNAAAIDEIKKLQRMMIQKLDALQTGEIKESWQPSNMVNYAASSEVEALQKQIEVLMQQAMDGMQQTMDGMQKLDAGLQEGLKGLGESADTGALEEHLLEKLDEVKLSVEDTVHKENIKCYRNVQGAIEEQGDVKEYNIKGLKQYMKVIIWFQIFTIILLVLRILGLL